MSEAQVAIQHDRPPEGHHPLFSPSGGLPRAYFCPASATFVHALKQAGIIQPEVTQAGQRGSDIHRAFPAGAATDHLDDHDQDLVGRCRAWWQSKLEAAGYEPERDGAVDYEVPTQVHTAEERAITWGWCDAVAEVKRDGSKHLVVCDVKTHREAPVSADVWSIQLQAYASGLLEMFGAQTAEIWVYCPEVRTEYCLEVDEQGAEEFRALVSLIVDRARKEPGRFHPGPAQCQYCPARAHCPAAREAALELAEVERPQVPVDLRKRGELLQRAESAVKVLGAIVDVIKHDAYEGAVPDGYKVVDVRGRRFVPSLAEAYQHMPGVDAMALLERANISVSKLRDLCKEAGVPVEFLDDLPRGKATKRLMRES